MTARKRHTPLYTILGGHAPKAMRCSPGGVLHAHLGGLRPHRYCHPRCLGGGALHGLLARASSKPFWGRRKGTLCPQRPPHVNCIQCREERHGKRICPGQDGSTITTTITITTSLTAKWLMRWVRWRRATTTSPLRRPLPLHPTTATTDATTTSTTATTPTTTTHTVHTSTERVYAAPTKSRNTVQGEGALYYRAGVRGTSSTLAVSLREGAHY